MAESGTETLKMDGPGEFLTLIGGGVGLGGSDWTFGSRSNSAWLLPFTNGFRTLGKDCLEASRVYRRKQKLIESLDPKTGATSGSTSTSCKDSLFNVPQTQMMLDHFSRQELRLLRQAPRDFIQALPLVLFFLVPGIGYLAPVIGLRYPTRLLPSQFWTPEQCQEAQLTRARAVANVVPYLPSGCGLNSKDCQNACIQTIVHLDHVWLDKVPTSSHVQQQLMRIFRSYRNYRRSRLLRHSLAIQVEDQLLLREIKRIDDLDLADVEQLCLDRGIYPITSRDLSKQQYVERLKDWLEIYRDTSQSSGSFIIDPVSFLLRPVAMMDYSRRNRHRVR